MFSASAAIASPWPEFPPHPYPVDAKDVKAYWADALPRPRKPQRDDSNYYSRINDYYRVVANGRSLIRRLQAGFFIAERHFPDQVDKPAAGGGIDAGGHEGRFVLHLENRA